MKRNMNDENSGSNKDDMEVQMILVHSYCRIRKAVRFLRRDRDIDCFYDRLSRPTIADAIVLRRILILRENHSEKK